MGARKKRMRVKRRFMETSSVREGVQSKAFGSKVSWLATAYSLRLPKPPRRSVTSADFVSLTVAGLRRIHTVFPFESRWVGKELGEGYNKLSVISCQLGSSPARSTAPRPEAG